MDPRVIEKYTLKKEIGRGQYGTVYLAQHRQLGELKAIKELIPKTETEKKRVQREIKLLQQAQHPHVIKIDEVFTSTQATYICMEYAEGGSLEKKLKHRISRKESMRITLDILRGVQALHARGIIHRDLKPGNILFDEQGKAKIGDFGVAKTHNVSIELTEKGKSLGTIGYMSPEQLVGERNEVDEQSDVYAVGVMLYEMLVNTHPFRGVSHIETINRALEGALIVSLEDYKVDKRLQSICYSSISKDKENRYRKAREMLERLNEYYMENEYGKGEWKNSELAKKGKRVLGAFVAGMCMTGISLGMTKGENSIGSIWARQSQEYHTLHTMKDSKHIKDVNVVQENIHRTIYNSIQGRSEKNITENLLEGEKNYRFGMKHYEGKNYEEAYKYFIIASKYGSIEAYMKLGDMYFNGEGIEKNKEKSIEYYKEVARVDEARGSYYVGKVYIELGQLDKGREYLKKAALKNHQKSIEELIEMFAYIGDNEKVQYFLKKGVKMNNRYSLLELGKSFLLGEYELKKNEKQALLYIKKAIRSGNQEAIKLALNMRISDRYKKKKLLEDIFMLLDNTNVLNDKGSQFALLGEMYVKGLGVNKNYVKAKQLYEQAVELGNSEAVNNLGMMYCEGMGVKKDYSKARELYEQAKSLGSSQAIFNIGSSYEYGHGVDILVVLAQEYYEEAIAMGNTKAMIKVGDMYYSGLGKILNDKKAKELYEQAAGLEDRVAINKLGVMYYKGRGVGKNYERAKELYEKAMALGEVTAMSNLGELYYYGHGVERNFSKARELCQEAVGLGCSSGMVILGVMYENGDGLRKSYAEAVKLYRKSVKLGNSEGMARLGYMYEKGSGLRKDYVKAKKLYKQGAEYKNSNALNDLGRIHLNGYGVTKNYWRAIALFEQAAHLGSSDAINNLGDIYYLGLGVERNYEKAREFYEQAMELGNNKKIANLGTMYHFGHGVEVNYNKAKELYEKGVELGDPGSMNNLGTLYYDGYGVEKNYLKAKELFEKSLLLGNKIANNNLDKVKIRLKNK